MPVRKYRDVSEMKDIWHKPGSPELFRAIRATWDFAQRTLQPYYPPGVYKHKNIESLQAQRAVWEKANFERYQARQAAKKAAKKKATPDDSSA